MSQVSETLLDQGYSLLMAVKVSLIFVLLYIYLPSFFIRFKEESDGLLDKVFITLTHSTLLAAIIVHILVFIRLYETFSLMLFSIAVYFMMNWVRGRTPSTLLEKTRMKLNIALMDWFEDRAKFTRAKRGLYNLVRFYKENAQKLIKKVFSDIFTGWFSCDYFGYGQINLYRSILLIRFLGPITGVLLLLGVYYFTLRITGSRSAALISLVIYGLVTNANFPSIVFRQTAALPQEFGAIYILPGLYFLWLYLKDQDRRFLLLYTETLALTVLIHSYAASPNGALLPGLPRYCQWESAF